VEVIQYPLVVLQTISNYRAAINGLHRHDSCHSLDGTMSAEAPASPPSILPTANDACWCGSGRKYKRCHKPLEGKVLPGIISPRRVVPPHITPPPYAETGKVTRWKESAVKTPEVIERMRVACSTATEVLRLAESLYDLALQPMRLTLTCISCALIATLIQALSTIRVIQRVFAHQ